MNAVYVKLIFFSETVLVTALCTLLLRGSPLKGLFMGNQSGELGTVSNVCAKRILEAAARNINTFRISICISHFTVITRLNM